MSESAAAHVLIFPYPAQGHMLPLLNFTHQLVACGGVAVTVLVTPKNLPILNPLLSAHPHSITPLVLPFPAHPGIPSGAENTIDLPAGGFLQMMCTLEKLRDPIIDWFRSHPSPPVAIVSDMFMGWTHRLAGELGVPSYAFLTTSAWSISFFYNLWRHLPEKRNIDDCNEMVEFTEIPNSPTYPWWQLSAIFRSYVKGDSNWEFIRDSLLASFENSRGMVINTCHAWERVYLEYLCKLLGHDRIWSIGPALPPTGGPAECCRPSLISHRDIKSWLDTCQVHSVVYICFGSQAVLTNEQMQELAAGLEKSDVKFILSVKGATKGHDGERYGAVPLGFEDRVGGRGLLIRGWAPQVEILRHPAVCAFLTHCGWNSVLESIFAGVPMLAWPMTADQFLNATLVVDQMKVAVRVCEGAEAVLESEDLVKYLGETAGHEWQERRARVAALSKAAAEAITEGGSSVSNLDAFTRKMSENRITQ